MAARAGNSKGHNSAIALTEAEHEAQAAEATAPGANAPVSPEPEFPANGSAGDNVTLSEPEVAQEAPKPKRTGKAAPSASGYEVVEGVPEKQTKASRYAKAVQFVLETGLTVKISDWNGTPAAAAQVIRQTFAGVSARSATDPDTGTTGVYVFPETSEPTNA